MKVDEFVEIVRKGSARWKTDLTPSDIRIALATIESQRAALKRIAVEECGCGVPCDCHSWAGLAAIARAELDKEV